MIRRRAVLLRWWVVVVAVATTACGAGSGDPGTSTGGPETSGSAVPHVLVIGDSNVFESATPIDEALRACGLEPTIRGVPTLGLRDLDDYWLPELPGLLATDPDVVVVALGANDAATPPGGEGGPFDTELDAMMRALPEVPVLWLTHVDQRVDGFGPHAAAVNERIRAAASRWDRLGIIDFTPALSADPTLLRSDGLHFSPAGMQEYARRIAQSAAAALGRTCPVA